MHRPLIWLAGSRHIPEARPYSRSVTNDKRVHHSEHFLHSERSQYGWGDRHTINLNFNSNCDASEVSQFSGYNYVMLTEISRRAPYYGGVIVPT